MAPRGGAHSQISGFWRVCRLSSVSGGRRVLSLWLFYMQASVSWTWCELQPIASAGRQREVWHGPFWVHWRPIMLQNWESSVKVWLCMMGVKSNQITFIVTSPQHKCLGEWNSYERAPDSAEKQQTIYLWTDSAKKTTNNLHMDRQCKKNNKQFTYGQTVQKKQQTIYIWTDSAKKTTNNLHMDRQCKKTTNNLHMDRQCKKTTAIYIWTVHIYRLYRRQCAKYTYIYSVHIVYYRDILNYQRHIIHRMGTSTLCTLSIHNVVYT